MNAMNMNKRPISITILGCIYLAVGLVGFIYHLIDFLPRHTFQYDAVWIELTEAIAIVCGVFLLRGRNWARWIALLWMAFHVVLSVGAFREFAIHALLCVVIGWILFRPAAARYFRASPIEPA